MRGKALDGLLIVTGMLLGAYAPARVIIQRTHLPQMLVQRA